MTVHRDSETAAALHTEPAESQPPERKSEPGPHQDTAIVEPRRRWLLQHGPGLAFLTADIVAVGIAVVVQGAFGWVDLVFAAVLVGILLANRFYSSRFTLTVLDDAPRLVGSALVAGAIAALLAQATSDPFALSLWPTPLVMLSALLVLRGLGYQVVRSMRQSPRNRHNLQPTLIIGAGIVGQHLATSMQQHTRYGLRPVGFIDDSPLAPPETCSVPVVGGTADLAMLIDALHVEQVIVAFTAMTSSAMIDVIRTADRRRCEISVVPRLFEMADRGLETDELHGMPILRLRRAPFRSAWWPVKRVLDVTLSGVALVVLSPLLLATWVVLRLADGPGVIFCQERVGVDGRTFQLLKFRSLRPADEAESRTRWTIKDDQRVGRVGRFIRKTAIDELPQLWNVLRGDMSLVGPRPERPYFVDAFGEAYPHYGDRHRVPCGLTGWAQIHGLRGDTSIEERARFDNYYVENWSLWLDVKIMLRTLWTLFPFSG